MNITSIPSSSLVNFVPSSTPNTNNAVDNASPSIDLSDITLTPATSFSDG